MLLDTQSAVWLHLRLLSVLAPESRPLRVHISLCLHKVTDRLFQFALAAEVALEVLAVPQIAFGRPMDIVLAVLVAGRLKFSPTDLRVPPTTALCLLREAMGFSDIMFRPVLRPLDSQPSFLIRGIYITLSPLSSKFGGIFKTTFKSNCRDCRIPFYSDFYLF